MNTEIKNFNHPQFGEIRAYCKDGKGWFCLSDVCKSLGIGNPSELKKRLQRGGIISTDTPITNQFGVTYIQKMIYVNEPNLYRCIFQSRKAEAVQYQDWVFEEVLPQIHHTGGYIPTNAGDNDNTILMKALKIYEKTCALKDDIIESLKPKALYYEKVMLSPSCYTMTQVAKELSMTVHELQGKLQEMGIIYRSPSKVFMLYADYLKNGYEAYRTRSHEDIFGNVEWTDTYLVWTEKGKEFIRRMVGRAY